MTSFVLQPWQLLVAIVAGMVKREQLRLIEYLRTENQVLREKLGKKRFPRYDSEFDSPSKCIDGSLLERNLT